MTRATPAWLCHVRGPGGPGCSLLYLRWRAVGTGPGAPWPTGHTKSGRTRHRVCRCPPRAPSRGQLHLAGAVRCRRGCAEPRPPTCGGAATRWTTWGVFIIGGVVFPSLPEPAFGASSSPAGRRTRSSSASLSILILDAQINHALSLTFVWVPRDLNVCETRKLLRARRRERERGEGEREGERERVRRRGKERRGEGGKGEGGEGESREWERGCADYQSHAAESQQHLYTVRADRLAYLDGLRGPHSIDRFATADDWQPLAVQHTGRLCSQLFHPLRSRGPGRKTGSSPIAPGWSGRVTAAHLRRGGNACLPLGAMGPAVASPGPAGPCPGPAGPMTWPAWSRWATL